MLNNKRFFNPCEPRICLHGEVLNKKLKASACFVLMAPTGFTNQTSLRTEGTLENSGYLSKEKTKQTGETFFTH